MSRSPAPARRGAADRRTLPGRHEPRAACSPSRIVVPPNDTNREPRPRLADRAAAERHEPRAPAQAARSNSAAETPPPRGHRPPQGAPRPHAQSGRMETLARPGHQALSHHHSRAARRALRRVAVVVVVVRGGWSARTPAAASNTGAASRHVRTHASLLLARRQRDWTLASCGVHLRRKRSRPGDPRLPVGLGDLLVPGGRARRLAGCARRARPPGLRFLGSAARGSDRPRRGPGGRRRGGRPRAGAQPARRRASPPTLAPSAPALTHGGERSPQLTSRGRATRRGAGAPHRESCRRRAPDRPTWCPVRGRRRAPRGGP